MFEYTRERVYMTKKNDTTIYNVMYIKSFSYT